MGYKGRVKKQRGRTTKSMEKPMCNGNGTLAGTDEYSSHLPVIGLYIAGGSLVCFILILCDVCSGFRRKKLWIPCRFFSLNSFTLTLVFVATKIPVDLTTAMPSAEDQLAKLTGTAFICVTMCFMVPSLGTKGVLENYSNVAALSLSVIAMIINVCMQISTGVIASYLVVEHAIILYLMLVLLIAFWLVFIDIKSQTDDYNVGMEDFIKLEENMKNRLYISYIYGYIFSPQFVMCRELSFGTVAFVCTGCLAVLFEALLRVLVFEDLEFCSGVSDYKWSIWLIVVIQILSVVLVSFAILSRWYVNATCGGILDSAAHEYDQLLCLFASTNLPASIAVCCRYIFCVAAWLNALLKFVYFLILLIFRDVIGQYCCCFRREYEDAELGLKALLQRYNILPDPWLLGKASVDMVRCIENNKHDSLKHLVNLLSTVPPSPEEGLNSGTSCLSLVLLVEIAKLHTPASLNMSLTNILAEVFDDIHFIDGQINIASSSNRFRSICAKVIWKYGLIFPLVLGESRNTTVEPHSQVGILDEYLIEFDRPLLREEEADIVKLINRRSYATHKELYDCIEQLFGDMLRFLLAPSRRSDAILKYISESPMEEHEDRVRYGFKLYCKFDGTESLLSVPHSV